MKKIHGFMIIICCILILSTCYSLPQGYNYQQGTEINKLDVPPSKSTYVSKQFYIHSAPDDTYDEDVSKFQKKINKKKNLQVVFIKSPENNSLQKAALQLAKEQNAAETIVYVLTKQTDYGNLQNKLQKLNEINPNKPEVHFIKYKTPEESKLAQQKIQTKYDYITGVTNISDEGIAPVISYIGSTNNYQPNQSQEFSQQSSQLSSANINPFNNQLTSNVSNKYLPALA